MNKILIEQVKEILQEEDSLAALCNTSALLNQSLVDINWVGFYLYKNNQLVLGPFQGKVACTRIPVGKGVCGTSFENKLLLNIDNVHEFPGHIACDNDSKSELVVPLIAKNKAIGVLDIDSPSYKRFSLDDEETMSEIAKMIAEKLVD